MTPRIVIRRVGHILDIFTSESGWERWSRYIDVKGYLKYLRGQELSKTDMQLVKEQLK